MLPRLRPQEAKVRETQRLGVGEPWVPYWIKFQALSERQEPHNSLNPRYAIASSRWKVCCEGPTQCWPCPLHPSCTPKPDPHNRPA